MPLPIAVLGGGLVGRLTAWQLAKQGFQVALFERGSRTGEQSAAYIAAAMLAPLAEGHAGFLAEQALDGGLVQPQPRTPVGDGGGITRLVLQRQANRAQAWVGRLGQRQRQGRQDGQLIKNQVHDPRVA